jgi:trans-aconitate 2-methyltransferase
MLSYRIYGNLRIDKAVELILKYVDKDSRILDIGCGHIWACDIANRNIEYAQKTVLSEKVTFFTADIIHEFSTVKEIVADKIIDVVTMVDVIEHLPSDSYEIVLNQIASIMSTSSLLILTYPSPQYQQYLREHDPEELQIIDESIEIEKLIQHASKASLKLLYFSYPDLPRANQYVYCVFAKEIEYDHEVHISLTWKFLNKLNNIKIRLMLPILKHKYIDQPLKSNANLEDTSEK